MRCCIHLPAAAGLLGVALLAPATAGFAQDPPVPFSKMTVEGGVMNDADGTVSMLSFDVDFTLGEDSDGIALGGAGEVLRIETSIGLVPDLQDLLLGTGLVRHETRALRLDIEVKGECFGRRNGRFLLSLEERKQVAACVLATLQPPGSAPLPLDLLQSMRVNLWRRGRPDRWRMRSTAEFAAPVFGYPVAGLGPGSWTALVIGDDRGQVATSAVVFEGGRRTSERR